VDECKPLVMGFLLCGLAMLVLYALAHFFAAGPDRNTVCSSTHSPLPLRPHSVPVHTRHRILLPGSVTRFRGTLPGSVYAVGSGKPRKVSGTTRLKLN
jgi:hypothetical protein